VKVQPVRRSDDTANFLDGTSRSVFLLNRCAVCGTANDPQALLCRSCGSDQLVRMQATGDGHLVTWATVHFRPRDGVPEEPTTIGVVQLDEGIWWWSQLVDADVAALTAGTRVTIEFRRAGPSGEAIPVFKARLPKSEDHEGEGGGS
jgi:uncharacterized OB-fold protein